MTQQAFGRPVVYAIDDEPDNLDLITRALSATCEVKRFRDPRAALAAVLEKPPTVVLVDFRMPELNGADFLRELRKAGVQCAALMVTAFADFEEVSKVRKENLAFRIISKPWDPEDLKAQVALAVSLSNLDRTVASLQNTNKRD